MKYFQKGMILKLEKEACNFLVDKDNALQLHVLFLREPDILLSEEATASLDSDSEYQIQQVLSQLMKNGITVVIAHRLSTVERKTKPATSCGDVCMTYIL